MVKKELKVESIYKACSDNFKIVSFESNGEMVKAVVDKFGNILSPFFEEKLVAVNYSPFNCLVIGKDKKNKKSKMFSLHYSDVDLDKSTCKKIDYPYDVVYATLVNKDTILFLTSEGLCFFDTKTLEQKSDFYDSLYYNDDKNVKSWVYEKNIHGNNYYTKITGLINTDGSIGKYAYDTTFGKQREIVSKKVSRFQYDLIDISKIVEYLNEKEMYDNSKKRYAIRELSRY